jgi:hypothetical protein
MGFWIQFIISVALQAVTSLILGKPQQAHQSSAEKFEVPTAQEGQPIPILFGTRRISGPNVAWYGDIKTVPIKSGGGKK